MEVADDDFINGNWILDSGASSHMNPNLDNLSEAQEYSGNNFITIGNGLGLNILHIGNLNINTNHVKNEFDLCSINVQRSQL